MEEYAVSIFFITGTFTTETMNVCLHEQNVYCIEAMKVQVRTHQVKTESFKVCVVLFSPNFNHL